MTTYNFLLFSAILIISKSQEFYQTFQLSRAGFAEIDRIECRSAVETFKKGIRCCYSSQGDGVIDTCSPKDDLDECITDNTGRCCTFSLFSNANYSDAKNACESIGRKLCTVNEYHDLCLGTGCAVDFLEAWTSETCEPVFRTFNNIEDPNELAVDGKTGLAAVRCCTLEDRDNDNQDAFCVSRNAAGECWHADDYFADNTALTSDNQEAVTYTEAAKYCEEQNLRLCDYDILTRPRSEQGTTADGGPMRGCLNTGCRTNRYYVWSRTSDDSVVFTTLNNP